MTDISVHISEFEKLKDEQIELLGQRDRLRHQTMLMLGGGLALMVQFPDNARPLMVVLPMVSFITGMSRVSCDRRIETIGSYIHHVLTPRLQTSEGDATPTDVFEWENYIRQDSNRHVRKALDLLTNLILYVGSGAIAIGLYANYYLLTWGSPHKFAWLEWFGISLDVVLISLLTWQMARHAHIHVTTRGEALPVPKPSNRIGRMFIPTLFALGTFYVVVLHGPQILPQFDLAQDVAAFGMHWRIALFTVAASVSAALVWLIGLFSARR